MCYSNIAVAETTTMTNSQNKKTLKKVKKVLDKQKQLWYNIKAVADKEERQEPW